MINYIYLIYLINICTTHILFFFLIYLNGGRARHELQTNTSESFKTISSSRCHELHKAHFTKHTKMRFDKNIAVILDFGNRNQKILKNVKHTKIKKTSIFFV